LQKSTPTTDSSDYGAIMTGLKPRNKPANNNQNFATPTLKAPPGLKEYMPLEALPVVTQNET
jgi:hypothetical protein